jgi:hypothetical protein
MFRPLLVVGALVLAALAVSLGQTPQQAPTKSDPTDYKISQEDIDRKNPVKSTPEGLAQAKRVFGYDCEMCHGALGDGKGDVVESMKLNTHNWRDPATLAGKSDGELFYIITKGKGKMMGEGERQTETLRWNLVNLVRSMAAKTTQEKPTTATP